MFFLHHRAATIYQHRMLLQHLLFCYNRYQGPILPVLVDFSVFAARFYQWQRLIMRLREHQTLLLWKERQKTAESIEKKKMRKCKENTKTKPEKVENKVKR